MITRKMVKAVTLACALVLGVSAVQASVVVGGTRVVYPSNEREVVVKISNDGPQPALVQTWLDDGDANATPQTSKAPFAVAPPIFRLDPKKTQSLRVLYTGGALPQDRESVFWLNVLEVPPRAAPSPDAPNSMQLAFRTRIKLFYRPVGLPGNANDAASQVSWKFVRKNDGHCALEAVNPTPYYVNFTTVTAHAGGGAWTNDRAGMVGPRGTADFDLGKVSPSSDTPDSVNYTFINDYGAGVSGTTQPHAK